MSFVDEAGPSKSPEITGTSTFVIDATISKDDALSIDLCSDTFSFVLSNIFTKTLVASLTSKDAFQTEIWDYVTTDI